MKNLQVRIKTDISTEPVTNAEAKLFCKVTGTAEDSLFTILVKSARQSLEKYTSSSFAQKTIHATWITLPEDYLLELPYGPIISVDKVYYIDEEGTEEEATLNSDYWVFGGMDVVVKLTKYWVTGIKSACSVRVEYTAGYGHADTETLPEDLKEAILKQIATDYGMREDISPEGGVVLSNSAKSKAAPYRRKLWF
jgi:uncharacterized phiE125 gp8 family phage protein